MRFDVNRLSKLAGLQSSGTQKLNEASRSSWSEDPGLASDKDAQYGKGAVLEEKVSDEDEQNEEVVYEVDAKELKEELARIRRRAKAKQKQNLQETNLKRIIEQEVKNVFKDLENGTLDLNITGGWVYGDNKPKASQKGRIARGFKSIGFK